MLKIKTTAAKNSNVEILIKRLEELEFEKIADPKIKALDIKKTRAVVKSFEEFQYTTEIAELLGYNLYTKNLFENLTDIVGLIKACIGEKPGLKNDFITLLEGVVVSHVYNTEFLVKSVIGKFIGELMNFLYSGKTIEKYVLDRFDDLYGPFLD